MQYKLADLFFWKNSLSKKIMQLSIIIIIKKNKKMKCELLTGDKSTELKARFSRERTTGTQHVHTNIPVHNLQFMWQTEREKERSESVCVV